MKNKYFTLEYREEEKTAEVYIFGDITSWPWIKSDVSSWGLAQRLMEIPEDVAITVHVNSNGGEVKEGLAIYNVLKGRNVTTICDGFAASAASVVFCAGSRRIMNKASLLFVHQAITGIYGNADDMAKQAADLNTITESAVAAYKEAGVKLSDEEIWTLLKNETWISPKDAVGYGFATEIAEDTADEEGIRNDAMENIMAKLLKEESCTGATVTREDLQSIAEDLKKTLTDQIVGFKLATNPVPAPAQVENKGFFGFRKG